MFFALCLFALMVNSVTSTEYGRAKFIATDDGIAPMDISLDKTYMVSYPGKPVDSSRCFDPTVNFHDFEKGLVALKSVDKGTCYVKPTPETFQQVQKLLQEFQQGRTEPVKQGIEGWEVPEKPLKADQVALTVGKKIAKFCTGYKVYILQGQKTFKSAKEVPAVSKSGGEVKPQCNNVCGFCRVVILMNQ